MAEEKEFLFEDWLAEGIKGFRASCKKHPALLPDEFFQHTRTARREMLLAMRSLVDTAIEYVEEKEEKTKKKTSKIKVE